MSHPLLVILGPTASGKTKLAVSLAKKFNAEIISADSRQIFKDMDIGTGKDLNEYAINGKYIPYHLINIKEAGEKYHVDAFKNDFYKAYTDILERNVKPILCGGTGMYIHSLLQNQEFTAVPKNEKLRLELQDLEKNILFQRLETYPNELTKNVDYSSSKRLIRAIEIAEFLSHHQLEKIERPVISPFIIGLQSDVESRRKRIFDRLELRLKSGLIEEVEALLNKGISKEILIFYGLEYKFITSYLSNELDFETLKERLGIAICQFAKRQMTFFRKMEKDGVKINWFDVNDANLKEKVIKLVEAKFDSK
ncbi:tRNA (adenosine(37)-N6)-dimethylallyltransferase MiaA [Pedobacter frigiditerrae]|uniref:tRNA dimethylallyltransferase n=1 Tax=Pedobacter frigiditerrae TaxID=2530452 RepID=A0A4R0MTP0_9SPHI|nr:tRNA (adenosine(37)-N6)-dimethylallyltransferase MiaA [Pedobacter frigiditerrae]TCC90438.1 tRNA (adenosine(37)-N6)-dimethylallyltransferase MiaA [Pedobacter frigiditerrae]